MKDIAKEKISDKAAEELKAASLKYVFIFNYFSEYF